MKDITPELSEQLLRRFRQLLATDPTIRSYRKKLKAGKMVERDCALYTARVAKCASKAATQTITEATLPDGTLYWNIAESVLTPLFEEAYAVVMAAAVEQKRVQDEKAGRHIAIKTPPFPKYRVKSYLDLVVSRSMKEREDNEES